MKIYPEGLGEFLKSQWFGVFVILMIAMTMVALSAWNQAKWGTGRDQAKQTTLSSALATEKK